ncbi:GDSL-type esterase/lipase family protein [Microterricola viridarii]|uniref:Lipase n=1 Tax=Microterricola viridarii TaxID=412690 RepID=A0A0X8E3R3_9MICO|nr:GDSL-type esterase/lipase family protein [Microterricola viridarii]AMB59498.1 lipase [Microterricola viridarii]
MISTPITESLIHGAAEVEPGERGLRLHRLPDWARRQFPDAQLLAMEAQPSGVRLVVRTAATSVELTTHPSRVAYRGAERPRGRIDVLVDGALHLRDELNGGDRVEVDLQTGDTAFHPGPAHITRVSGLPAGEKRVEFWLPHNETLELLTLRSDAPLVADASPARVWLHHGSSISHGSNAAAPTEIWPAVAALRAGVSLRNLGLGGSALADPFLARVMRDTPADLISVKLGINLVNLDVMRLRAFVPAIHGFLDTIRDGHPDTPLLLVSPIFCGIHEKTPGPGAFDPASFGTGQMRFIATGDADDATRLTLERIRRELHTVMERRADDPHLHFLEGTALYGEADAVQHPLPDGLHPDGATHQMIGERFVEQVFAAGGAFAPAV